MDQATAANASEMAPAGVLFNETGGQNDYPIKNTATIPVSSRELIRERAEHLVAEVNAKRKRDTELLEEFKKDVEVQMSSSIMKIESSLYHTYECTSKEIDGKLEELANVLERIEKLESELDNFKKLFGELYKNLHNPEI